MLALDTRLRPNEQEVAAKVMDGEAVIINLATGSYYAMAKVGGLIWEAIEQECSLEEVAGRVTRSYDVTIERARADVQGLATELLTERVVHISDATRPSGAEPAPPARLLAYEPPTLSAYSDMRNLLALDPPMPTVESLARKGS